jgi:eukaryotic-like serine/threonine-protein kinase
MTGVDAVRFLGDRYRLIEPLGAGGMSVVWRAFDEVLGRPVAVKLLAPGLLDDPASRELIRAEAHTAALLSHPNITAVYDYGESIGPFVVMELIDGKSLEDHIEHVLPPWPDTVMIGAQVAAALAAVHARGLVHRDIKPANVMLTTGGVKVVDFGISAIVGDLVDPRGHDLLGTPAYIAPERLKGAPATAATDVYALGVLLYKTFTGKLPWKTATTAEMLRAHYHQPPEPMPRVAGLPHAVRQLTLACLAKEPGERPTADEVARRLFAVKRPTGRPSRMVRAGVATVGVAAAVLVFFTSCSDRPGDEPGRRVPVSVPSTPPSTPPASPSGGAAPAANSTTVATASTPPAATNPAAPAAGPGANPAAPAGPATNPANPNPANPGPAGPGGPADEHGNGKGPGNGKGNGGPGHD